MTCHCGARVMTVMVSWRGATDGRTPSNDGGASTLPEMWRFDLHCMWPAWSDKSNSTYYHQLLVVPMLVRPFDCRKIKRIGIVESVDG